MQVILFALVCALLLFAVQLTLLLIVRRWLGEPLGQSAEIYDERLGEIAAALRTWRDRWKIELYETLVQIELRRAEKKAEEKAERKAWIEKRMGELRDHRRVEQRLAEEETEP